MRLGLIALVVVLVSGCSPSGGDQDRTASDGGGSTASPSADAGSSAGTDDSAAHTEEPAVGEGYPDRSTIAHLGTAATCDHAGREFCEDADGNVWPDFVEEAIGRDPQVDDCAQSECADVTLDEFLAQAQDNTLFILDASGSMAGDAGEATKMDAAKEALIDYVSITPEFADLGLLVYGHRGDNSEAGRPESCAGIDTFAPVGELTPDNIGGVVGQFQPTGWTPIAAALDAAGPVLQQATAADADEGLEGVTNRVILISDGIETCDGDPVASATALQDLGIQVVVDVVGFDLAEGDRAALQAVAQATGGIYSDAADRQGLREVFAQYAAQRRAVSDVISCLISSEDEASGCRTDLYSEASAHLFELADELMADDDTAAEGQFIERWTLQALQEDSEAQDAIFRANSERLAELDAQLQEAFDRSDALEDATFKVALAAAAIPCPRGQGHAIT